MSQEEQPLSRAEKKAQRDAERHKKSKKRKHAETEEQDAAEAVEPSIPAKDLQPEATESTKKSKKRKSKDLEDGDAPAATNEGDAVAKQPKKKRKKTKAESATTTADGEQAAEGEESKPKPSKSRFILFIGNLSFKTTTETLRAHFKKLEPFTLRHLTDPRTKKSKGCAFVEFENYDRMKTCLKLYHHSIFDPTKKSTTDPEIKPADGDTKKLGKDARKINVELTAGGGGKTEGRKEKIKVKNTRLEEQRKRRAELERKEKAAKEKKEGGAKGKTKDGSKPVSVKEELEKRAGAKEQEDENASHGIHPSRLARLNN